MSLFKVQIYSQRMKFVMTEDFQRKCHRLLRQLPRSVSAILACLNKYVAPPGDCFEGDNINLDEMLWHNYLK